MNNLAIIPARSGSKGLSDKNIKMFFGKPMMFYSIHAAIDSGIFSDVVCSTDSEEYAQIAKGLGASVPFLRSEETSSDFASSWDVVREVVEGMKDLGKNYDTVALLQPTSPLRDKSDLQKAYKIFSSREANTVMSVCEVDHSPLWCATLDDTDSMRNFGHQIKKILPRQALPTYYRINGAVYIRRIATLSNDEDLFYNKCYAYVMDKRRSIDIDDYVDFIIAETIMKHINEDIR